MRLELKAGRDSLSLLRNLAVLERRDVEASIGVKILVPVGWVEGKCQ
jgi:hypothetical protein